MRETHITETRVEREKEEREGAMGEWKGKRLGEKECEERKKSQETECMCGCGRVKLKEKMCDSGRERLRVM